MICQFDNSLPKDPVFVIIPVKDKIKKNRIRYLRCPGILPHELLHYMASTGQFQVDSHELQEFWRLWSLHKPHHPAATEGLHWPLGLGGDDAKYTLAGSKVIIICMNHILFDRKCRRESHRGKTPTPMNDSFLVFMFFVFWWERFWSRCICFLNPRWNNSQLWFSIYI